MIHRHMQITEIRIDLQELFDRASRRTLDVVKAIPDATPDQYGLSVDELDWMADQVLQARSRVAMTLHRLSKGITHCPQAEQSDCDTLVFRVICSTPIQAGLLSDAVMQYMTSWIAAAWFRLHPEMKTEIDMDAELSKLNHITLISDKTERPYRF